MGNEYIHEVTCPNGGKSILVRPAMRSDRMGIPTWKRGPMLGEHTEEVLKEIGYTDEQIKAMEERRQLFRSIPPSLNIWMRKCKEGDK